MAPVHEPVGDHLHPLERGVDVARRAAERHLLAEHVPRLDCTAQLEADPGDRRLPEPGETELPEGLEPAGVEVRSVAEEVVGLAHDVLEVGHREGGQEERVVQAGAPAHERPRVGLGPEPSDQRSQQRGLHQRHPGVRRHLEATHLQQAEPAPLAVGAVELVDAELGAVGVARDVGEQVPEQPVHQPRLRLLAVARDPLQLGEGDLELVERLVAALVHPGRLAGGPDEASAEDVGQRRVVLPVGDQAAQEVRAAQQWRVCRRGPAQGEVVAATGPGVGAVLVELLGRQPDVAGVVVEALGQVAQLRPGPGGLDVDLDHARVRGHRKAGDRRVAGQRVALEHDRHAAVGGAVLDHPDQLEGPLGVGQRWQEDEDVTVARLHGDGVPRRLLDVVHGGRGHDRARLRERRTRGEGRGVRDVRWRVPRERVEGQAVARGRVAQGQEETSPAQSPLRGAPSLAGRILEDRHDPRARRGLRRVDLADERRVRGDGAALRAPGVVPGPGVGIVVRRQHVGGGDAEPRRDGPRQVLDGRVVTDDRVAPRMVEQGGVTP